MEYRRDCEDGGEGRQNNNKINNKVDDWIAGGEGKGGGKERKGCGGETVHRNVRLLLRLLKKQKKKQSSSPIDF